MKDKRKQMFTRTGDPPVSEFDVSMPPPRAPRRITARLVSTPVSSSGGMIAPPQGSMYRDIFDERLYSQRMRQWGQQNAGLTLERQRNRERGDSPLHLIGNSYWLGVDSATDICYQEEEPPQKDGWGRRLVKSVRINTIDRLAVFFTKVFKS